MTTFPYNIISCPELPIIDRLKKEIEISNYCIIKGAPGCGKSITAYQLSFYYYEKGYKVFRYKNNDDEFDYNIKDLFNEKAVFIIDDFPTPEEPMVITFTFTTFSIF